MHSKRPNVTHSSLATMPELLVSMSMLDQYSGATIKNFADKSWSMENVRQLLGSIKADSGSVGDHLSCRSAVPARQVGLRSIRWPVPPVCQPSARSTLYRSDVCAGRQASRRQCDLCSLCWITSTLSADSRSGIANKAGCGVIGFQLLCKPNKRP
jgi:hypothetical protein